MFRDLTQQARAARTIERRCLVWRSSFQFNRRSWITTMREAADRKGDGAQVTSLAEVRDNIDRLDRAIVALIAERGLFVEAAARCKTSQSDVEAPERVEQVIAEVRSSAQDGGLSPDVVECTY